MRLPVLRISLIMAGLACLIMVSSCANRRKLPALSLEDGIRTVQAGNDFLVLAARLVTGDPGAAEHAAGSPGTLMFEVAETPSFTGQVSSGWDITSPENDYTVTARITGLRPGTVYYCRARFGATSRHTYLSDSIRCTTTTP